MYKISELKVLQSAAFELASELEETAEKLSEAAKSRAVNYERLMDIVFENVNMLRDEILSRFRERTETRYKESE